MKTLLITGATGTTGSATLQALQQYDDLQLRAMTRDPGKAEAFHQQGIKGVVGDFSSAKDLDRALQGVDRIFLVHTPSQELATNEKRVIDAAKNAGVERIVKISVYGCDPEVDIFLPRAHAAVEQYLKDSGIAYTLLRPHSFMQNLLGSLPTIQGQGLIYSNAGEAEIPLIDARDIGAVAAAVLYESGHEGKVYELTGPRAISYQEVAKSIGDAIGKQVDYVSVPDAAAQQGMTEAGFPKWLAEDLVALMKQWREGINVKPTKTVEKVLGRPARSIQDFANDFAGIFKG